MKALLIAGLLMSAGCTTYIDYPMTGIKYTGSISEEVLSITALPPFWSAACELYSWMVN